MIQELARLYSNVAAEIVRDCARCDRGIYSIPTDRFRVLASSRGNAVWGAGRSFPCGPRLSFVDRVRKRQQQLYGARSHHVYAGPRLRPGTGSSRCSRRPSTSAPIPSDLYNPTGCKSPFPQGHEPLANALNTLDGFSTTAVSAPRSMHPSIPRRCRVQPALPATGRPQSIFVLDVTHGMPLVPGVHYMPCGCRAPRRRRRSRRNRAPCALLRPRTQLRVHHDEPDSQHGRASRPAPTSPSPPYAMRISRGFLPFRANRL